MIEVDTGMSEFYSHGVGAPTGNRTASGIASAKAVLSIPPDMATNCFIFSPLYLPCTYIHHPSPYNYRARRYPSGARVP